jgi:para-nitrobenzyl esterase
MILLKNIKYFKFFILLFLSSLAFSTHSEPQTPSTPSEPPIPHTMSYDYLRENGSDFFSQGVVTYKGDFIQTSSGKVITQRKEGILYWEDIPFALPPVGNLRWEAPTAFVSEDFNINPKENNFCHQEIGGQIQAINQTGSEDCLYLDIRGPHGSRDNLPVMFWIHGGGNTSGHKDFYNFSELVKRKDIIVVSPNYRLGPLGFFTHPAIQDSSSGTDQTSNFGILDIVLALKWVNENIASFGGDPNNITIFGESAGGHNVLSLLVAQQAKGLFHKAISQSGYTKSSSLQNAYKSENFNQEGISDSWTVLNKIIVDKQLANDLNEANTFQLNSKKEALRKILYETNAQDLVNLYGDTFETPLLTNDGVVIPEIGLKEALRSKEYLNKVPTIAGSNKDEIKLWLGFSKYFIETNESFLSKGIGIPKIEIKDEEKYQFYNDIRSKGWQLRGVQEPLENIFDAGNEELYAYRYDWDNLRDFFVGDFGKIIGSAHALEIPMISGDFSLAEEFAWIIYPRSPSRRFVSKNMMNFWTEFAKNGEPGKSSNNIIWNKYNPKTDKSILHIDEKKDLRINSLDLSMQELVNEILSSQIIDNEEKCILLYETTNYIGDNSFDDFAKDLSFNCSRDEALRISQKNSETIDF